MSEKHHPLAGPTGRFPEGKQNAEDEGELRVAIATDVPNNVVRMDFGKPVKWLSMVRTRPGSSPCCFCAKRAIWTAKLPRSERREGRAQALQRAGAARVRALVRGRVRVRGGACGVAVVDARGLIATIATYWLYA